MACSILLAKTQATLRLQRNPGPFKAQSRVERSWRPSSLKLVARIDRALESDPVLLHTLMQELHEDFHDSVILMWP